MASRRVHNKRKADELDDAASAASASNTQKTIAADKKKQAASRKGRPLKDLTAKIAAAAAAVTAPEPAKSTAAATRKATAATKQRAAPLEVTPPPSLRDSDRLKDTTTPEPPAKRTRASPKSKAPPKPKPAPKAKPRAPPKPKVAPKKKLAVVLSTPPTERLGVFACGTGEYGELGLGPSPKAKIVQRPRLNALLPADSLGVVAIAYGGMHGAALTHDGKVYTWGVNDLGALGRVTKAKEERLKDADADSDSEDEDEVPLNEDESTPKQVEFPEGVIITRIAAGDSVTVAVTNTGLVYGWGTFRSNDGVLGFTPDHRIQNTPLLIKELKGIVDVVCGNDHALALDIKGKAWAWGNGQQNQLGRRVVERTRIQGLIPREIGIRKKIKSIHSGSFHSFAVTVEGVVYSWGLNSFAQCGIYEEAKDESTTLVVPIPTIVKALNGLDIVQLDGGDRHSTALTGAGELYAWGRMDAHQVGIGLEGLPEQDVILDVSGKPRCLIVPHKVTDTRFTAIASGTNHNIALGKEDGAAYSWGFGDLYQCGQGPAGVDVPVPTKIENTATRGVRMVAAVCGGQITVLAGILAPEPVPAPQTNGA